MDSDSNLLTSLRMIVWIKLTTGKVKPTNVLMNTKQYKNAKTFSIDGKKC